METTFKNSVDILVRAFLNDTLKRVDPCGCAIGNLIRGYCGIERPINWYSALYKSRNNVSTAMEYQVEQGKEQIAKLGYSMEEVDRIEATFEKNAIFGNFEGLMAVVDVLADIHGVDLSVKEEAKSLFVKECV